MPNSLWTDPFEGERGQHWIAPRPEPRRNGASEPQPPRPDERPPHRRRRVVAGVVAAALLVGAGAIGGAALDSGDEGGDPAASDPAALPAASAGGGGSPATRGDTVREVYAAASPSVVSVRVGGGSGTGFLIDEDGTIVTNAHVVGNSRNARIRLDDGGREISGRVLGSDPSTDLAVLRIPRSAAAGVRPLRFADSGDVQVGDLAVAIGYPLGLDRTATSGIVSGLRRQIESPNGFSIDEVIQTDAPINPGNSGGPLLDSAGRVIGVNSQIATTTGGSVGIGFAVPSNTAREVVPRLVRGEDIKRAFMGVSTTQNPLGAGALVAEVTPGGPAASAGIRRDDVIVKVGKRQVERSGDVVSEIESLRPGERVAVVVQRDGRAQTLEVELGTRPDRTGP